MCSVDRYRHCQSVILTPENTYPEVLCHCLLLLQPTYFVIPTGMVKAAWEEISIIFPHLELDIGLDSISLEVPGWGSLHSSNIALQPAH